MAINPAATGIYERYAVQEGNGNGIADGLKSFQVNGNEVLFEEVNGETFTVQVSAEEMQTLQGTTGTQAANNVQQAQAATNANGATSAEIQKEIDALNETKAQTVEEMEKIEATIQALAEDVKNKIAAATKESEKRVGDYEEKVEKAVKDNVAQYIAANKADGKGMTHDELQQGIASAVGEFAPDLSDVVSGLFVANSEIDIIDIHLGQLKSLATTVSDLESQISVKESAFNQAKAAEEAAQAAASQSKSCDPIGFTDAQGNKFDFVVMDGAFDTTSDFLGSTDNWDAMKNLDTSGDGKVDLTELEAGKIGLTMNGSKDLMDADAIKDMFGEDFAIELTSYNTEGTHSAISADDSDKNGVVDQDLQGTFKITLGNKQTLEGYNTLDDQEWLAKEYGLTADVTEAGAAGQAGKADEANEAFQLNGSEELQAHVDFINEYTEVVKELRASLQDAFEHQNLSEDLINLIGESSKSTAEVEAAKFYTLMKNEKEAEEAKEGENAEAAENEKAVALAGAEDANNEEADEDKKEKKNEEEVA